MTEAIFAIPGDIDLPTGGYAYDRRVLALLPAAGMRVAHLPLPHAFPDPKPDDLAETERLLRAESREALLLIDGLAYGALPSDLIGRVDRRIVALVHHPLYLEAGLVEARRQQLYALERAALALARHVIVTSPATARTLLADFAVPQAKITVAAPGTDAAPRARGTGKPLQLLAVGSVVPRKAFHILVRAMAPLRELDWKLTIVGPIDRSAEALDELQSAIAQTAMHDRVTVVGSAGQSEIEAYYDAADIFVMPSLYEGYGMVLAEAMARGLPIVCTTGGAAAETVPDAAGIKLPPGDIQAFGDAVGRLCRDSGLRRHMADASWSAGQTLPPWQATARQIAETLRRAAA